MTLARLRLRMKSKPRTMRVNQGRAVSRKEVPQKIRRQRTPRVLTLTAGVINLKVTMMKRIKRLPHRHRRVISNKNPSKRAKISGKIGSIKHLAKTLRR